MERSKVWRVVRCFCLCCLGWGGVGCDTVARISFADVTFEQVEVLGVHPSMGQCRGSNGPANVQMVLIDNEKYPIHNASFGGTEIGRQDVRFEQSATFSLPDVACAGVCSNTDLTCGVASSLNDPLLARCHQTDTIEVLSAPTFVPRQTQRHFFGVLMEDSGSLYGRLPDVVSGLYPDFDGDGLGDAVGDEVRYQRAERASDSKLYRIQALNRLVDNWRRLAAWEDAPLEGGQNYFGLWFFGDGAYSLIADNSPTRSDRSVWTISSQQVLSAIKKRKPVNNAPSANVYEAAQRVLSDPMGYADPAYLGDEKVLVLFVDGVDDLRLPDRQARQVIDAAKATNTKLYVVHLDAALAVPEGVPLLWDSPEYVKYQQGCTQQSDCGHFESCKPPTRYSTQPGTATTRPPVEQPDAKFCYPRRDALGRVGPIQDYAQMACETGGGYLYVKDGQQLASVMAQIPYTLHGHWRVDVSVASLDRRATTQDRPWLLQSSVSVETNGQTATRRLEQSGPIEGDRRMVLFQAGQDDQ